MPATDDELRGALTRARTIAIVGLSDRPERDSNEIARYLKAQGYRIVPINPMVPEVLGERSYPSVAAVPAEIAIDIVDVFRRSELVPPVAEETARRGAPVLWMQLGIANAAAAEAVRAAGGLAVEDRCIMVEHRRLGIPPIVPAS